MSVLPEPQRKCYRVDFFLLPPSGFVALSVKLPMVKPAQWNGEFIAHLAAKGAAEQRHGFAPHLAGPASSSSMRMGEGRGFVLGAATEELNRGWYERNTGRQVRDVQRRVKHSAISWMAATLDGIVEGTEAVFEAKFMLPWSFSEEAAADKYMAQLQHNMWVTHLRTSVLSIITGGGKWVEITIPILIGP